MKANAKRRGRPPKGSTETLSESILFRLSTAEKAGFQSAARVAGIPLAIWMRERLRRAATRELEEAARPIPFLKMEE
jgi:hypothetical protein